MSDSIGVRKTSLFDVPHAVTIVAGLASIVSVIALVMINRATHPSRTLLIATSAGGAVAFTLFVVGLVVTCRQKTKAHDNRKQTAGSPTTPPRQVDVVTINRDLPEIRAAAYIPRRSQGDVTDPLDDQRNERPEEAQNREMAAGVAPADNNPAINQFVKEILPKQMENNAKFLTALLSAAAIPGDQIQLLTAGLERALCADYLPLLANGTITIEGAALEIEAISGIGCDILVNDIGYVRLTLLSALSDERIRSDGPNTIITFINKHFKGSLSERHSSIKFMRESFTAPILEFAIKLVRTKQQKKWLTLFADAAKTIKNEKVAPLSAGSIFIANGIRERNLAF